MPLNSSTLLRELNKFQSFFFIYLYLVLNFSIMIVRNSLKENTILTLSVNYHSNEIKTYHNLSNYTIYILICMVRWSILNGFRVVEKTGV